MKLLRFIIVSLSAPIILLASSNWDQLIWDQDKWWLPCQLTQEEWDRVIANSVSEKDQVIAELQEIIDSMFTQEQVDQFIVEAVSMKDQVIDELNETVLWLPGAGNSIWGTMIWDHDDWFIDVHTLVTPDELEQAVANTISEVEAEKDLIISEKDDTIFDLSKTITSMFTQDELMEAVVHAIVDKDGDGLTDEQEIIRGSDPESYEIKFLRGWNLFSVSRVPNDNSTDNILGAQIPSKVWTWEGNKFIEVVELLPLRGYWVHTSKDTDVEIILSSEN